MSVSRKIKATVLISILSVSIFSSNSFALRSTADILRDQMTTTGTVIETSKADNSEIDCETLKFVEIDSPTARFTEANLEEPATVEASVQTVSRKGKGKKR